MAVEHVADAVSSGCAGRAMGGNPGAGRDLALPSPDSPSQPRPRLLEALPNGVEEEQNLCSTVLLEDAPADEEGNHGSHDHQGKGSLEVEVTSRNEVAHVGWRRHIVSQKHQGYRIMGS